MFITLAVIAALAAVYAGTVYGKQAEAKAIAEALKVAALVQADYRSVIADVKAKELAAFARLKSLL